MKQVMNRIVVAALVLFSAGRPLAAQHSSALDRAETFAAEGKYGEARATLTQWWSTHKTTRSADAPLVARALMLRARLTMHPDTAERDYLRIVLEHPTSPQTPEALLRLGQHFLARGDTQRARVYLRRLASDYPNSSQRATALTFLARADSMRSAPRETRAPTLEKSAPTRETRAPTLEKSAPTRGKPDVAQPTSASGAYALQCGAFRLQSGASSLAALLRKAGYDARIVSTGGQLRLVRVGHYASTREAVDVARRVRAQGFTAVVVDDVVRERAVR
jgi:cell division septation protein DedD